MKLINYKFEGLDKLPMEFWKPYFKESKVGNYYKCLVNDRGLLVMSDTEYEIRSNKEVLDKAYGDVLLIGLGINLINDKVLDLPRTNTVDTIEINSWVIQNIPSRTNIIHGDFMTYNFDKKYDTIWFDPFCTGCSEEPLKKVLKPEGQLLSWNSKYGL